MLKKKQKKVYISLPYIMAAVTAGIDRNDEITPLSPYLLRNSSYLSWIINYLLNH